MTCRSFCGAIFFVVVACLAIGNAPLPAAETPSAQKSVAVEMKLGERQVLFVAPDNDATRRWGVYGCPDMYRAADGSIVVYDGGHMDTHDTAAATCPAVSFRSTDEGRSWQPFVRPDDDSPVAELREGYGASEKVFRLADGGQVQFLPKGPPVDLAALAVKQQGLVMVAALPDLLAGWPP